MALSNYCGCEAKIIANVDSDQHDKEYITIKYTWKHTGHNPLSAVELHSGPANAMTREAIIKQVEASMTWKSFKNMLRLDKQLLLDILEGEDFSRLPLSFGVTYNEVYYAMKVVLQRRALLDKDFQKSLEKWGEKITSMIGNDVRGFFFEKNLNEWEAGMFAIAFTSKWQLDVGFF